MTHPIITPLIIATLLLISGSATFFLPETMNKKLPDTLEDVTDAWGKKKNRSVS